MGTIFIKMKLLLLLSAFVAGSLAIDRRELFLATCDKFREFDALPKFETPQATKARYDAFNAFMDTVDEINGDEKIPYEAEANFLSVLTEAEKQQHLGFNSSGHVESPAPEVEERLVLRNIPESRDFADKISPLKNQGRCGSCWTYAATAALEGEMYFQNSKSKVSLSEQEYMECSTTRDGCQGGWMKWCYAYTQAKDRIATTSSYPYTEKDSRRCQSAGKDNAMTKAGVRLTGNIEFKGDANLLKYASAHIVSVAIFVSNKFMPYKKGVLVDNTCNRQPNHAVAVVGYGKQDGRKYWKVRNSWGTGWGDKGYVLMDRQTQNTCYISTYSHIPRVQCRDASNCKPANPDEGSDGSDDGGDDEGEDEGEDEGDDSDDEEQELCAVKIPLIGKCFKTQRQAANVCDNSGIPNCAIVKMNNKCYYSQSEKMNKKKYIEMMMPCDDDNDDSDGKDDQKCDAAAGLVFCNDCQCCKHEHMCKNRRL